jgi:hypothetical protein
VPPNYTNCRVMKQVFERVPMRYANDNPRPRTRADEQFTMLTIALGASVLFIAIMWLAG